jgi:hypothetical protein
VIVGVEELVGVGSGGGVVVVIIRDDSLLYTYQAKARMRMTIRRVVESDIVTDWGGKKFEFIK